MITALFFISSLPAVLYDVTEEIVIEPVVETGIIEVDLNAGTRGTPEPIPRDGDWYIDGWEQITSASYILKGNLIINGTGTLILINTTIIFDPDAGTPYGVIIEPGGTLNTTDLDGDPSTPDDYSSFKINETKMNSTSFTFLAKSGSNLVMKNTIIRFGKLDSESNSGVLIKSANTELENSIIENSLNGLVLEDTSSVFVDNIEFLDIKETSIIIKNSSNTHLFDLNLSNQNLGVQIIDSQQVVIEQSEFYNNKNAVQIINSKDIELNNSALLNSDNIGLNLINTDNVIITESDLSRNTQGIYSAVSSIIIRDSVLENNSGGAVFQNSSVLIRDAFNSNNTGIALNGGAMLTLFNIQPLPNNTSLFWTNITVDSTSELHVDETLEFSFQRPDNFSLPGEGNYTIIDSSGSEVVTNPITLGFSRVQAIPIRNLGGELEWLDPFNVFFQTGGYFLNESFSIFDSSSFSFQLEYNNPPILRNASVEPDRGDTKTSFTFTVEYRDADGDAPAYVNLIIENLSLAMARQDEDVSGSPSTGIIYKLEFSALDDGHNLYYFETDDGQGHLNSRTLLIPGSTLDVKPLDKEEDKDEDSDYVFIFLTLCIVMLFVFVIFVIAMNYMMQKKMSKAGGVPPGTLPEEMYEEPKKDLVICSECGSEIDSLVDKCPKCGEEFEGEEFQCPKCDNIVPESATMCPNCGNKFLDLKEDLSDDEGKKGTETQVVDKLYCSECGAVVDEDMSECPGCGENFEGEIEDDDEEEEGPGAGSADEKLKKRKRQKKSKGYEKPNDLTFICSVCGASVREGDNTCPECQTEFK